MYEAFLIASLILPLAPLNAGWSFCHNRGPAWCASQMRFGSRYALLKFNLAESIHSLIWVKVCVTQVQLGWIYPVFPSWK
jgi:hypothetical protein